MEHPTILLLEDEPVIAADLSDLLAGLGCRVLRASDSGEALGICAARTPDLVVLNFRHPDGSDGLALARVLRDCYRLKVGFLTGVRPEDIAASLGFQAIFPVLYKPFTRAQWNGFLMECGML